MRNQVRIRAIASSALAIASIVAASPLASGETADTMIPNAGFEAVSTGDSVPEWTVAYPAHERAYSIVTDPVWQGTQAVRITDESDIEQRGLLSTPVSVAGGDTYDVSAWVKVESGTPGLIIQWFNEQGEKVSSNSDLVRTGPSDWQRKSFSATAPPSATSARVMLYSATTFTSDAVWDDVSIAAAPVVTEESLGAPISAANVLDTSYGVAADGSLEIYSVTTSSPAVFQVLDAKTGEEKHRALLGSGANGAWTVLTASDGRVYIGVYPNGHVYRWDPAASSMEDLGRVSPEARNIWDLEEDSQGRIWGGTYPRGEVFSFDPAVDEFTFHTRASSEEYVRSIAIDDNGKIYAGTGSTHATIVVLDPSGGTKSEIPLPAAHQNEEFVYNLDIRGSLLFTRVSPTSTMLVYDLESGEWITDLGKVLFGSVSPIGPGNFVYYVDNDGTLMRYHLEKRTAQETDIDGLQPARDFGWLELGGKQPGLTLSFMYLTGEINHVNLTGKRQIHNVVPSEAAAAPVRIQTLQAGPDGRVYVGGYMYDGLSIYDPASGDFTMIPRGDTGQIEGMWSDGDDLYIGSYTRANLYRFDTTQPWATPQNPLHLASLHDEGQDRPFAWTSVDDFVVTGTVPGYGQLGGALATINRATNEVTTYRNLIPDQSVVSLTSHDNIVYGSTSIWGGIGIQPTTESGKVFAWDPETKKILWERVIAPDATAITRVAMDSQGRLWAVDAGTLFEIDPTNGEIIRSRSLVTFDWTSQGSIWVSADIQFGSNGTMYVLARGELFRGDPNTFEFTRIASGGTGYSITLLDDDVYMAKSDELVRLSIG